jgi:hypothetical protein
MVQIKKKVTVTMRPKSGFGTRIWEQRFKHNAWPRPAHLEGSPRGSRERYYEGHWSGYESEGRERHCDALATSISSLFPARTAA